MHWRKQFQPVGPMFFRRFKVQQLRFNGNREFEKTATGSQERRDQD